MHKAHRLIYSFKIISSHKHLGQLHSRSKSLRIFLLPQITPLQACKCNYSEQLQVARPTLRSLIFSPFCHFLPFCIHGKKKKSRRLRQVITGQDVKVQANELALHFTIMQHELSMTEKAHFKGPDLSPACPHCWSIISLMNHCRGLSVLLSQW